MSWVDYSILAILGLSALVGVLRGLIRECLGVLTWVGAIVITYLFGGVVARQLSSIIPAAEVRLVAGYALLFIGALFIGALITHLIGTIVRDSPIARMDRVLGAGFGLLRGLAAVVIVIMLADTSAAARDKPWWNQSVLIPPLLPLAHTVRGWIPQRWQEPLKTSSIESVAVVLAGGN
jgi:membrane protein required for colicin V production